MARPVDYEEWQSYSLVVRVVDSGVNPSPLDATGTVGISVDDINDVTVTSVSQPTAGFDTRGGEVVNITGTNFGPAPISANQPAVSVSVTYGYTGVEYTASDCTVVVP